MKAIGYQARSYRRGLIVNLHAQGHKQRQIAQLLDCSQGLVSTVLKAYAQHADQALLVRASGGRKSSLLAPQRQMLTEMLQAGALASGFPSEGWTLQRIRLLMERCGLPRYSLVHLRRLLLRMGFSRQVPAVKDYQQDPVRVETWRSQTLEELKKSP